jgi:hypothetical protein
MASPTPGLQRVSDSLERFSGFSLIDTWGLENIDPWGRFMRYNRCYEAGFDPEETTYIVRIKDEFGDIRDLPVDSLEEFTDLLSALGRKKIVLNLKDRAIELMPRTGWILQDLSRN